MAQIKLCINLQFWFWRGLYSCGSFASRIHSSENKVNSSSASMTARIPESSHYFIVMDLSKICGIICMQLNFNRRAMR